uniref:Uncharacterized protein n=1 Tax=Panagrolaimus sp. JU765 TaxID=591449 RepID=A0AC34Q4R1_9BILA
MMNYQFKYGSSGCFIQYRFRAWDGNQYFYSEDRGCMKKSEVYHPDYYIPCNYSHCNSHENYPPDGRIFTFGNYKYLNKRGCALDNKPFSKENKRFFCDSFLCNSPEKNPPNGSVLVCSTSTRYEDEVCEYGSSGCYSRYWFRARNGNQYLYLKYRGCMTKGEEYDREYYILCNSSHCNSYENHPPNGQIFTCVYYSRNSWGTTICDFPIRTCFVEVAKTNSPGQGQYHKYRGCFYADSPKNVVLCDDEPDCNRLSKYKYDQIIPFNFTES